MIKQVNFIDHRKGRQRYPDGENRVLNLHIVQQEIDVRLATYAKRVTRLRMARLPAGFKKTAGL